MKVYTERVREWAIEHPDVEHYARAMPTREDRAWALRAVALVVGKQLLGVDFDAVQWQAIVDAVTNASKRN